MQRLRDSARSKLATAAWFVARPAMYRELGRRLIGLRIRTSRTLAAAREEKEEGRAWCSANVLTVPALLERLGAPARLVPVSDAHPLLWKDATAAFEACKGTMGGPAHVDLLHHLVRWKRPARVVETGVAAGWSSLAILAAMNEVGQGHLTSIDMPYPKRDNEALVGCVVPAPLRSRWTLIRLPDRDGLPKAVAPGPIGLCHYDSDKSYGGRAFAYALLWKALEPGGILVSDDVEDNLAFRDFAREVGREPLVVEKEAGNYAGILVR